MTIFIGSTNPVKIAAVTGAICSMWPDAQVKGYSAQSGVSDQPRSDQETRLGAENRARAVLSLGLADLDTTQARTNNQVLGVGLEGGVFTAENGELWSTVWAAVVDQQGRMYTANGARFKLPAVIAEPIIAGGEMGPVVESILKISDVRKKQGMIGVVTNNFVDRTGEYMSIAKMAIGLWYGRDWQETI